MVGGSAYVAAGDEDGGRGQVARVPLDSGDARWEQRVAGDPFVGGVDGDVAVFFWDDADSGAVTAGAYDVDSGESSWEQDIGQDQDATVIAVEGGRVVLTSPGLVTALEAATGEQAWRKSADSGDDAPLAGVREGVVYVADGERTVAGYALADGERTLRFEGSARANDIDVRDGRIFVASDDGAVYAVT